MLAAFVGISRLIAERMQVTHGLVFLARTPIYHREHDPASCLEYNPSSTASPAPSSATQCAAGRQLHAFA